MTEEFTFTTSQPVNFQVVSQLKPIATIANDGAVLIDWTETEKRASASISDGDVATAIAKLMIAIRDGTWKPIEEES